MLNKFFSRCFKRHRFRSKVAIVIVIIVSIFYFLIAVLNWLVDGYDIIPLRNSFQDVHSLEDKDFPIVIWWTPFTGDSGSYKQCGSDVCYFTDQRSFFNHARTKAFIFYGSDFKPTDLPLPRQPTHDWALLHEESPKNNFMFSMGNVLSLFNHTATFRRASDLPLTLQYLDALESITSMKYFVPTAAKNAKLREIAPIVYLHSDCNTPSERDSYVEELMKYIKVDSYGKCLHNTDLPPQLSDPITSMHSDELYQILSQYKFTLSMENAVCEDYITEKLWRPLTVGSVPIYYGSPSVKDWLPNADSAILLNDFLEPKSLASHINFLLSNNDRYDQHLKHKIKNLITNENLVYTMKHRNWGINNDPNQNNFIENFECLVCHRVSENYRREIKGAKRLGFRASLGHYGCPKPIYPFSLKKENDGWWPELYNKAKYEANALEKLVEKNVNFSATNFYQEVIDLLEKSAGA